MFNICRETSNYHRCGRTDKGVSAFGQVRIICYNCNILELGTNSIHFAHQSFCFLQFNVI